VSCVVLWYFYEEKDMNEVVHTLFHTFDITSGTLSLLTIGGLCHAADYVIWYLIYLFVTSYKCRQEYSLCVPVYIFYAMRVNMVIAPHTFPPLYADKSEHVHFVVQVGHFQNIYLTRYSKLGYGLVHILQRKLLSLVAHWHYLL